MKGLEESSWLIESAQELSVSLGKFITYCQHLSWEFENWQDFSENWWRATWYIAVLQEFTEIGNLENWKINLETVLSFLSYILLSDFFDENKSIFLRWFHSYQKLRKYSNVSDKEIYKSLRTKYAELMSGRLESTLSEEIQRAKASTSIEIDEVLEMFESFCCLLREVSNNPNSLYIPWFQEEISPSYTQKVDDFLYFLEYWEKNETHSSAEIQRIWKNRDDTLTFIDISDWYSELKEWSIEEMLLSFWMFLYKRWEFEWVATRDEIIKNLLKLARKTSKIRCREIVWIIEREKYLKNYWK